MACEFTNGSKVTVSLLVRAGGIHFTLREYVALDLVPNFVSMAVIIAVISTAQLEFPVGNFADIAAESNAHLFPQSLWFYIWELSLSPCRPFTATRL